MSVLFPEDTKLAWRHTHTHTQTTKSVSLENTALKSFAVNTKTSVHGPASIQEAIADKYNN